MKDQVEISNYLNEKHVENAYLVKKWIESQGNSKISSISVEEIGKKIGLSEDETRLALLTIESIDSEILKFTTKCWKRAFLAVQKPYLTNEQLTKLLEVDEETLDKLNGFAKAAVELGLTLFSPIEDLN